MSQSPTFAGDQGATVFNAGSKYCPATSPTLVFLATVLVTIKNKIDAERKQKAAATVPAEADFVVVGGGAAGCALAARLSEDATRSVVLLERGGTEPQEARVPGYFFNNGDSAMVEMMFSQPEKQSCTTTGCTLNVPKVLGGGSTISGTTFLRGANYDYDQWARITGDQGWAYKNVLQYFKKSEDNLDAAYTSGQYAAYHGRGGPIKVSKYPYTHPVIPKLAEAFKAIGQSERFDVNAQSQLGYSTLQTTSANGERWSAYRGYIEPNLKRANLHVLTFATARKVLLAKGKDGLAATGVEFVDAAGKTQTVRAKREVILTAGALRTPQILINSGIGPAQHLKELGVAAQLDLPVGQNLMDHPFFMGIEYTCTSPLCATDWATRQQDIKEYQAKRTGALAAVNPGNFMSFFRSTRANKAAPEQPDLQIEFVGGEKLPNCVTPFDSWRFDRVPFLVSLMQPQSRGSVRVNASDPHGLPVVTMGFLSDAQGNDLAVAVEGLKTALKMEAPLAKLGLTLDKAANPQCASSGAFGSDAYLQCVARTRSFTAFGWSGTARMGGASDKGAVLDAALRVRGAKGLRVCDAAAIPYIPSSNILAPTIMLAERCADLVKTG